MHNGVCLLICVDNGIRFGTHLTVEKKPHDPQEVFVGHTLRGKTGHG